MEEKSPRFSDYLFAQMSPENAAKVECTEPPRKNQELTGVRKWLSENLLLLLTLLGVAVGAIIGKSDITQKTYR
ncbi:hypothetical protein Zmor_026606 [Zophobas morio]|uniref:Uncharacterized protein n=1 Tax=Zophobas morio TaxID=2755281 RepID=A0AA38HUP9_9CUCU|nr:hypothetical protein Zmor_026606 [Zophobas morio]